MTINRIGALQKQKQDVLEYCRDLTDAEWTTESRAAGWRVQDVVAHFAGECKILFSPKIIGVMATDDTESKNEDLLESWRDLPADRVLAGFDRWSGRALTVMRVATRGPLGALPVPLGNLGRYPLRLLPSIFVFDWYTHLTHDIAPALGRPAPPIDEERMRATLEWMLAGMGQMHRETMGWLDRPISLTLTGLGGGTWQITPQKKGRLEVEPGKGAKPIARITAPSIGFPAWATTREKWRSHDITIVGDDAVATRFLDSVNII